MDVRGQLHTLAVLLPGIHWLGDCVGPSAAPGVWLRQKSLADNLALQGGKYVYSHANRNS